MRRLIVGLFAALLAGCSSSSSPSVPAAVTPVPSATASATPSPSPTVGATPAAGPQHLYVADQNSGTVLIFTGPFTPGITASGVLLLPAGRYPIAVVASALGLVAVTDGNFNVNVYVPPITNASQPVLTVPNTSGGAAFDPSGNLYVPTSAGVRVYTPPFSSTSIAQIVTGIAQPGTLAVGPVPGTSGQGLALYGYSQTANAIIYATPPFTAVAGALPDTGIQSLAISGSPTSLVISERGTIVIRNLSAGGTISYAGTGVQYPFDAVVDGSGQLIVCDDTPGQMNLALYAPPFAIGKTPSGRITGVGMPVALAVGP